ncbi:hypothetical protein JJB11_21470 [Ramlibacter ginsenosidimutans]|uniref:Uncharacterized protein n=1 Tax=Ramlibacter ginsenosidimutans TaxID=502333 RepID=A0A934TWD8_9BURK|nr:hypothetical protein [Ramlibacter ginsenosidimutans]MBK6008679.1 hypothetical protein [Ramlibacter ginsenosidimutans]
MRKTQKQEADQELPQAPSPQEPSPEIPAPNWTQYQHRPAARISDCCLLLMGLQPGAARKAGATKWPTRSLVAKQYNRLLAEAYHAMAGKNPLLEPLLGEPTVDRVEFQKVMVPLAAFVALANSDMSPFAAVLKQTIPDAFKALSPPIPAGSRPVKDLLAELRSTYSDREPPSPGADSPDEAFDADKELAKIKSRGDQQVLVYAGALLHWVHEEAMNGEWHTSSRFSLNAIESKLRTWLAERAYDPTAVPRPGTIRKQFAIALEAFRQRADLQLKPLSTATKQAP